MFYSTDILRTSGLGDTILTLRDCSKQERRRPGYRGVFATESGNQNIKRLLLIKENQISQGS